MQPTRYASMLKRFAAFVVDAIIVNILAGVLTFPLMFFVMRDNWHSWAQHLTAAAGSCPAAHAGGMEILFGELLRQSGVGPYGEIPSILFGLVTLAGLLLAVFYHAAFESSPRQATPGKMIMGLFVTDSAGRRLSFPRAFLRGLGRVLSQLICYLGFLVAFFTPRSQALHDLIAGTLVLEPTATRDAPAVESSDATGKDPAGEDNGAIDLS